MTEDSKSEDAGGEGFRDERSRRQEDWFSADPLLETVRDFIHESRVRRLIVRSDEHRTLLDVPLGLGVVGVAMAPAWAAMGAVVALVSSCSIQVEREDKRAGS